MAGFVFVRNTRFYGKAIDNCSDLLKEIQQQYYFQKKQLIILQRPKGPSAANVTAI